MERTIKNLANMDSRVYVFLENVEIGEKFLLIRIDFKKYAAGAENYEYKR